MESILKNQQRLELMYSNLEYELTALQAKYDDSQKLLEQTTYMLKLEQMNVQQNAANKSKSASPVHKYLAQRDLSENDSEIDPRDWIVPRPKTHTHGTLDTFCDLVYVDSTKNMLPSIVAELQACKVDV